MCEYKNNKSEAFTAVISLISLYNSVACHETHAHTQTHSHTAVHVYTEMRAHTHTHTHSLKDLCIRYDGRKVVYGHDTQVTSLVKDGKGEKVKTHAHKKENIYMYIYHSQKVDSPPSLFL